MATRLATGKRDAFVLLPLAVGLTVGTLLGVATLSWARAFILWQLLLWAFVSMTIRFFYLRNPGLIISAIPSDLSDKTLQRALAVTRWLYRGRILALLAGLSISIWIMVIGNAARASVAFYWLLPIAAFLDTAPRAANVKLSDTDTERKLSYREQQRKRRCSDLTSAQKTKYKFSFLMELYELTLTFGPRRIELSRILSELANECSPELSPEALKTWTNRKFIKVETATNPLNSESGPEEMVTLLEAGHIVCERAKAVGVAAALVQHHRCLERSDQEKAEYRAQLFLKISELAHHSAGYQNGVTVDGLLSAHKHPCGPELVKPTLQKLAELGLIDNQYGLRFVVLTQAGQEICEIVRELGSVEAAITERDRRHKRCLEATSLQRIEFEDRFLKALYDTTNGDTGWVTLGDVWERLNHECAPELTKHTLNVWRERKDINIRARDKRDVNVSPHLPLCLSAAGRDLCMQAIILHSMQEALSKRSEGYRVKNEYNVKHVQAASVIVGTNANVHDNEFAQFVNVMDQLDLDKLAQELTKLREELLKVATSAEDHIAVGDVTAAEMGIAIGAVSEAETAARNRDAQAVGQHLARLGRWILDAAKKIGIPVAVEAINAVFKAYKIPIS